MTRFFSLFLLWASPASVFAHGMEIKVDHDTHSDQLRIIVHYEDGTPAAGAEIILQAGGEIVKQGVADREGLWVTVFPGPCLAIARHEGHRARATITAAVAISPTVPVRWPKIALGLGIIATLAWLWLRRRGSASVNP
jgi:hypothetical protein